MVFSRYGEGVSTGSRTSSSCAGSRRSGSGRPSSARSSSCTTTANPPKRRIYANGYYSDWFDIKSGVAQGCPISPLLFLIIAQALRVAMDRGRRRRASP